MKKLITLSVASFAFAAMADNFSPNIGVQQFSAMTDNFILPVKFDSLNASAISAKELVATNGLVAGTTLYVFQDGSYTSWVLENSGWVAMAKVSDTELNPTQPSDGQVLASGSAIWITPVNGKTFSIYGKVITSKTSTIVRGKTNLLANPTDATVTGSTLAEKLSGVAQVKDKITPIGGSFAGYYVYSGTTTGWVHVNGTTITKNATLPDIAANQGFWYVASGSGDPGVINW